MKNDLKWKIEAALGIVFFFVGVYSLLCDPLGVHRLSYDMQRNFMSLGLKLLIPVGGIFFLHGMAAK